MRRHAKAIVAISAMLLTLALGATIASAVAPVLTVEDATNVSFTKADVEGTVDPDGQLTTYRFQYATQADFSDATTGIEATTEASETLSGQLTGLAPSTTYHLRLQAENADGQAEAVATNTFTTDAVAKPSVSIDPVTTFTASTAHFEGTVNPNGTDPAFDTSWSFECSPACPGLSGGSIPADEASHDVEADASGLEPNTEYTVTLKASNQGGEETDQATFTTAGAAPTVKAFAAGPVQAEQASINGEVNPHNQPTTYWFEWGEEDCSANPCQAIPATEDADAGSGGQSVYVLRQLTDLQPESTYHFRLIAKNASGTTEGADQQFTTAALPEPCINTGMPGTSFLPSCRGWEMVSPPDKNGGDVTGLTSKTISSADGDALAFSSLAGFGDVKGFNVTAEYLAERTAAPGTNGWSTHGITPPSLSTTFAALASENRPAYTGSFSPDLDRAVYMSWRLLTDAPNVDGVSNLYLRSGLRDGADETELLTDSADPLPDFGDPFVYLVLAPRIAATSEDLSHVAFTSPLQLTKDAPPFSFQMSLYEHTNGEVRHVGRIPKGADVPFCDDGAAVEALQCEAAPSSDTGVPSGPSTPGFSPSLYSDGMISADGSRIFFQAPTNIESGGKIYMREDGVRTFQLNASEKTVPEAPQNAQLWTISRDGSRAFFTTGESLTDSGSKGSYQLYMWSAAPDGDGHHLERIASTPNVIGVIGTSDDGHYLYFTNVTDLGALDFFAWHDGDISYLGTSSRQEIAEQNSPRSDWTFTGRSKTARVTPDGRHLLFTNSEDGSLPSFAGRGGFDGYDCDGCQVFYLYNADSGRLQCASCNPEGVPSGLGEPGAVTDAIAASRGGTNGTYHLSQALSEDGRYVFFSTEESMLPEDTNGAFDAYQYDSQSEELSLLSSGTDKSDSYFLDASDDGSDVFILTRERLVGWDIDSAYDVYDARVNGGLPEPPPVTADCEGESCRGAAPAPPPSVTPASAVVAGQGNPKPRLSCRRGQVKVRRKGKSRCITRKTRQSRGANAKPGGKR